MRKRNMYLLLVGTMLIGITGCGNFADSKEETTATIEVVTKRETQTDHEEATTELQEEARQSLTPEEAEQLLIDTMGSKDSETGYTYSFGYAATFKQDGTEYHVFVWSWLVDDHNSRLTDLFVATDGSGVFEGEYMADTATIYTEKNYLSQ